MAPRTNKQILTAFMDEMISGIRAELRKQGKNVTLETSNSLRHKTVDTISELFASVALPTLEFGRGPTKRSGGGSGRSLRDQIFDWIKNRGISPSGITQESLAFLISRKIHKEGNQLFNAIKAGSPPSGVISNVINTKSID